MDYFYLIYGDERNRFNQCSAPLSRRRRRSSAPYLDGFDSQYQKENHPPWGGFLFGGVYDVKDKSNKPIRFGNEPNRQYPLYLLFIML